MEPFVLVTVLEVTLEPWPVTRELLSLACTCSCLASKHKITPCRDGGRVSGMSQCGSDHRGHFAQAQVEVGAW